MSPDSLAVFAGSVLSLAFTFVPGLKDAWADVPTTYKKLIMGGLLIVIALIGWVYGCNGLVGQCLTDSAPSALSILLMALAGNQSTWLLTRPTDKPSDVENNALSDTKNGE